MLSYIDPILYPDECLVYEVEPNRFVYPIFKNGSSSLSKSSRRLNYTELKTVKQVEVFIREPFERYVSGVQTYLRMLDPSMDRHTVLGMISEHLFLNRHFALQFHWLVNFSRHSDAWLYIRPIDELNTATDHVINALQRDQSLIEYFQRNERLHYYLLLDKVIYEQFMGKTVHFRDIVKYVKKNHSYLYNEVIQRSKDLCSVLG